MSKPPAPPAYPPFESAFTNAELGEASASQSVPLGLPEAVRQQPWRYPFLRVLLAELGQREREVDSRDLDRFESARTRRPKRPKI